MSPEAFVVLVLALIARLCLSAIFALACAHKLRAPRAFFAALRGYRVLPRAGVAPVGVVTIAAEGGVAVGLWIDAIAPAAALGAGFLLAVYAAAIAVNLARGRRDIDCGCSWGATGQPISWGLVARNVALAALCFGVVVFRGSAAPGPVALVIAVASAVVLLLCHRAFETLLANAQALARLREGRT